MKYFYAILALFILFASILSCTIDQGEIQVPLGKEFALSLGQTAHIKDESLQVTFNEILEDSRCPIGATCVWQGRVKCILSLTINGSVDNLELTQPGLLEESVTVQYLCYELIFRVEPYPDSGESISTDVYRLILTINRS